MRILEERTKEVDDSLIEKVHPEGYRYILRGNVPVASESDAETGRIAKIAMNIPTEVRRLALIGGGFCLLPKLLIGRGIEIDVYECETALSQYANGTTFIGGDWNSTLAGTYDLIVYDVDEVTEKVRRRIAPHGKIYECPRNSKI